MHNIRLLFLLFLLLPMYSIGQDKTLDYYISSAINNSPLLNDYSNQLLANHIDSQLLKASGSIQIYGNGNSYYAPVRNGYGYDEAITNGGQLQALITATKNLIPKRALTVQFKDLQFISDSIRIASRISEQDLKKNIIGQYITTYGDQLQIQFNSELRNVLAREETVLKRLTQRNVYKQVDYLSFLVTYQQQELAQQQLILQYKNDYATLNYLAGIQDTTVASLSVPNIVVAAGFLKDTSVFFLKYQLDSLKLMNNKSLIDISYKPRINLYADGGILSTLANQPYKNLGNSFGINFVIPIYDGGQKKLQYAKIDIAEKTRLKNKTFFENQYYQQIAQLQQQLHAIDGLLGTINKQVKYIETLIDANGKLLETGDIKMTDYVLAINNLVTAKNLVVQNRVSHLQIQNQLSYWNR